MPSVRLTRLALSSFRNIERAVVEPRERFNVFVGANGAGKTNLLEAVYLLGALRSFRTSSPRDLLRHGAEEAVVEGFFGGAAAGTRCRVDLSRGSKRATRDGKRISIEGGHFGDLPMVLFHPGNLEIVQGGPDVRRRLLDRALYQAYESYPATHRAYTRALASRNRALKRSPVDEREISPFEERMGHMGSRVVSMRRSFCEELSPLFSEIFARTGGAESVEVVYRPSSEGDAESIEGEIRAARRRDVERGYSTIGPHLDDLGIRIGGRAAKRFASQGQQRAVALALRLAEAEALERARERRPILLLDDVSSELDAGRKEKLFGYLEGEGGQVFVTTTGEEHVASLGDRAVWMVVGGEISRVGGASCDASYRGGP